MQSNNLVKKLLGASSLAALSVGVAAVPAHQASAQDSNAGVYGGGSSLSSNFFRQVFDCYDGQRVVGDGVTLSTTPVFTPPTTPNKLPMSCGTAQTNSVEALFASVGSGRGQQAFIADDAKQLVNGGAADGTGVGLPGIPPLYLDAASSSSDFNTYPYPELHYTASDSPLPLPSLPTFTTMTTVAFSYASTSSTWATATASGTVTTFVTTNPVVTATSVVSYNSNFGNPIQLPAFEVPVTIAVNTKIMNGVQSSQTPITTPGHAMQLNVAQVCAIFSGTVTNWDSGASISRLLASGSLSTELFSDANVNASHTTGQAYNSTTLPIKVVYRGDGSGTSFIFTNFLKSSCVQLDNGSNHYSAIFSTGLPSTNFSVLVNNITANGNSAANFTGVTGSQGVAVAINNDMNNGHDGAIGYLSPDFTAPYSALSTAPNSASVQDENQRAGNQEFPTTFSFIAPLPAAANLAFNALTVPAASATYNDWNIYAQTYNDGSALANDSILGIPKAAGAYPIVGTTFVELYTCYNTAAKGTKMVNFLNWYFNGASAGTTPQPAVANILLNSGFNALNVRLAGAIHTNYLSGGSTGIQGSSCTAGTGA